MTPSNNINAIDNNQQQQPTLMTTPAVRTSTRIRRAPRRYDEEDWTPGANNRFTAGRKTDSWVSGELRNVDLEQDHRLARLEKASGPNEVPPILAQEIADKHSANERERQGYAKEDVPRGFALHRDELDSRGRDLDARAAELEQMIEDLEAKEVELQQATLDAKFIVPDGEADEIETEEDEEDEEEEAVSSDEEDDEDEELYEELEEQYESDQEEEDEQKDDWSDDMLPDGCYLEPASNAKCDWLGLCLTTVAVVSANTQPLLPDEPWFAPAVSALAVLFMWNQPAIGRAFAAALTVCVIGIVLIIGMGYLAPLSGGNGEDRPSPE